MDTQDLIIATSAIIGAVLGVFNLARSYLVDSERVRVATVEGGEQPCPAVEVVNVSPFPIAITERGEVYPDGQQTSTLVRDAHRPYQRVEARSSLLFEIPLREDLARRHNKPAYTYVRTALGNVFTTEPRRARWWRRVRETLRLKARDL